MSYTKYLPDQKYQIILNGYIKSRTEIETDSEFLTDQEQDGKELRIRQADSIICEIL